MTRPHLTEGCGGCLKLRPLQDGDRGGGAAAWRPQQYSWPELDTHIATLALKLHAHYVQYVSKFRLASTALLNILLSAFITKIRHGLLLVTPPDPH
eukprot:1019360-Pelagomonas_calceolata.AAC.1